MSYESVKANLGNEVAAADLSAKQFYACKVVSGGINLAGDGDAIAGIIGNKPSSGEAVEIIQQPSVYHAILGGTVAKGDKLAVNASGKFIVAVATKHIVATALLAGVADDVAPVLLGHEGRQI